MTKRTFEYKDSKSDKFWNIELEELSFLVTYGRSGTAGQTQTKSFESESETQSAANKLIAEKVKKGYLETTTGVSNAATTSPAPATATPAVVKAKKSAKAQATVEQNESAVVSAAVQKPAFVWDSTAPRTLKLDPEDYLWVSYRPRVSKERLAVEPKPFDKEDALKRAAKVPGQSYWSMNWEKAEIASVLSREEAHFWFTVMTISMKYTSGGYQALFRNTYLPKVAALDFNGQLGIKEICDTISKRDGIRITNTALIRVLNNLLTPPEMLEFFLEIDATSRNGKRHNYADLDLIESICQGFRIDVLPYLSEAEAQMMRERLKTEIDPKDWPSDYYEPPKLAFNLAALLGLHDEIQAVVKSWVDDRYSNGENWHGHYHRPQQIIFGLGSAEEVNTQMRRLGLPLEREDYVRAWLAHTEFSQVEWVKSSILGNTTARYPSSAKDVVEELTKTFALAEAREVAPHMLQLMLESKAPRIAREWLDTNPTHTVAGLLPVAAGRGKLADAAVEILRSLKKRGGEELLRESAKSLSAEELARVQNSVLDYTEKHYEPFSEADMPESLRAALEEKPKLTVAKSSWVYGTDLPPITFSDKRLSDTQVEFLLTALRKDAHPFTLAVKSSADRTSLDAFAWRLFERWLAEGAPSKEKWAMLALGQLGGDSSALKLTPLIRVWPGEAQHQRAVTGLECLRAIGTDTALMQINGIAQKVKFKGLQNKAVEAMEGIAADRGLSRAQLEDRVVPDLDLDENGTRFFDYGSRQFKFVLSPEMKPLVREEGATLSKPRPDLPKPTQKDDAAKAEAALAEWKLLKKQIAEAVKIQVVRLEHAMVKGRRWTLEEFEMLLARHPLMTNLVRLLVWEAASGNRRVTFRVVEDGTYADSQDETLDLHAGEWAHIGIAHPLTMTDAEKSAWGELFSDYEIVPPFSQIGRAVYNLEGEEAQGKEITRFKDIAVPPETLNFGLEKLGWQVGGLHDHGDYYQHFKVFESAGVTAWVSYEPGLFKGYREGWEPQKMTNCFFLPSEDKPKLYYDAESKGALLLNEIEAVGISEVLKDLSEIAAKGEVK